MNLKSPLSHLMFHHSDLEFQNPVTDLTHPIKSVYG